MTTAGALADPRPAPVRVRARPAYRHPSRSRERRCRIGTRYETLARGEIQALLEVTVIHAAPIPAHEQIAEFRIGAILATQAIVVYVDSEAFSGARREASSFDDLPERLKIKVLAVCEDEFRRRKEGLIRRGTERGDWRENQITMSKAKNVLGETLEPCSESPLTGFTR